MQQKHKYFYFFTVLLAIGGLMMISSCDKDVVTTDPDVMLSFSMDTVTFDTVFTSLGSTTKLFKVFNEELQKVNIADLQLAGGSDSPFRLNVDGTAGVNFDDVELLAEDSLYVFVEVTIDPTDENMPFIVEDSILFTTNGNEQVIQLVAYGQNAVILNNVSVCDETFTSDLPYVFFNVVLVPEDCFLNIEEGAEFFVHRRARFIVEGTLNINGTAQNPVSFQGDRLESFFDELSAQWTGIELLRGSEATVNHALLRNGVYGFVMGSILSDSISLSDFNEANAPLLTLNNSIIQNCFLSGISAFYGNVVATNTLIHTCGENNFQAEFGGDYQFYHSTLANYGSPTITHRDPIVSVTNAIQVQEDETTVVIESRPASVVFVNSIIHGDAEEEIAIAAVEGQEPIASLFDHCLISTMLDTSLIIFENCQFNPLAEDTLFVDRREWDFHLHPLSPAIDGALPTIIETDLEGNMRSGAGADIGCYEFL